MFHFEFTVLAIVFVYFNLIKIKILISLQFEFNFKKNFDYQKLIYGNQIFFVSGFWLYWRFETLL